MRHIIITMLGIGVARPSYFVRRIALLRIGLYRSLCAQTSRNFEWVLAPDIHIPDSSLIELQEMSSGHSNFHICLVDPIKTGVLYPQLEDFAADVDEDVIFSRVDEDDALNIT